MKPKHVYTIVIQTSNALLWDAITNPEITQHYFFNMRVQSDWQANSDIVYLNKEGEDIVRGEIIECRPISKLVHSFRGFKLESGEREPTSRVSFEIEELSANACKLTVIHDEFETEDVTYDSVGQGWPTILSGLKTWLETGKPLVVETEN